MENFVGFVEARVKTPPVDGVKRFIDLCPFRSDACKHAGNEWKGNKRRGNRREDFYAFTNSPSLSLSLSLSRVRAFLESREEEEEEEVLLFVFEK